MKLLDATNIAIEISGTDTLSVRCADGTLFHNVAFVQLFPNSDPSHFISAGRKQGTEFVEIGIIRDLGSFPQSAQKFVLDDIRRRYFVPQITEIVSIKTSRGADTWVVETDRGHASFSVRERGENVVTSGQGIVMITDIDKCRYKIADPGALSPRSRGLLEKVLM